MVGVMTLFRSFLDFQLMFVPHGQTRGTHAREGFVGMNQLPVERMRQILLTKNQRHRVGIFKAGAAKPVKAAQPGPGSPLANASMAK